MKPHGFAILIWLLLAVCALAAPRVAVLDLSKSPELEALLVSSLSRQKEIDLVERTEIARLVDEKRLLELAQGGKFVGLGTLLKADGLLIIERTEQENACSLRLISTRTGMCLLLRPCGGDDRPEEVRQTVRAVRRVAAKLSIGQEQALPLAIMNIRGALPRPENPEIEKTLRSLLEMGLSAQPNVVLLERRRLAEVNFERTLDASDVPPLVNAAFLIAGSFEALDAVSSKCQLTIQIKRAGADAGQTIEIEGDLRALPALGRKMNSRVLAALNQKEAKPTRAPTEAEAGEFLDEAVWHWGRGDLPLAEQALDSALALGHRSHDADLLDLWFQTREIIGEGEYKRPFPKVENWEEHAALAARILRIYRAYRAAGGEKTLVKLSANRDQRADDGTLHQRVAHTLLGVLREAPETASPETWQALQQEAREICGYDAEGRRTPFHLVWVADYLDVLAERPEEKVQFYSRWLKSDHPQRFWLLRRVTPESMEPETVRRLGEEFIRIPELSILGDLFLCRVAPPEKSAAAYEEYSRKLEAQAAALAERGLLESLLGTDALSAVHSDARRLQFVRTYLQSAKVFQREIVFDMFLSLKVSDAEAPSLWGDYVAYRERVLAATPVKDRELMKRTLTYPARQFLVQHPTIVVPDAPSALIVQRCWHHYGLPEFQDLRVEFNSIQFSENSVWLFGLQRQQRGNNCLIEIPLDSLQAKSIPVPASINSERPLVKEDAIFLGTGTLSNGAPESLSRYDRKTGAWITRPVTAGRELAFFHGKLYWNAGREETGVILQYDWASEKSQLLLSTDRRPARNQFEARKSGDRYIECGFFEAPNGKVAAVLGYPWSVVVYPQEEKGDWTVMKNEVDELLCFADCQLLLGANGEMTYLDPKAKQPELWLSPPGQQTPGDANARWELPSEWQHRQYQIAHQGKIAFRRGEFFILERNAFLQHQLRWYWEGGRREGQVIPLKFAFPEAQLERLEDKNNQEKIWKKDHILVPERNWVEGRIYATKAGLVFVNWGHGFWFIPNADLEAARKNYRAPAGEEQK